MYSYFLVKLVTFQRNLLCISHLRNKMFLTDKMTGNGLLNIFCANFYVESKNTSQSYNRATALELRADKHQCGCGWCANKECDVFVLIAAEPSIAA